DRLFAPPLERLCAAGGLCCPSPRTVCPAAASLAALLATAARAVTGAALPCRLRRTAGGPRVVAPPQRARGARARVCARARRCPSHAAQACDAHGGTRLAALEVGLRSETVHGRRLRPGACTVTRIT